MRKILFAALIALAAPMLISCGDKIDAIREATLNVENVSKPNTYVKTLALDLQALKNEIAIFADTKMIQPVDIIATEGNVRRATEYLEQATSLMAGVERDETLAASAPTSAEKATYSVRATAARSLAIEKARAADTELKPLRALRDRVRGIIIPQN